MNAELYARVNIHDQQTLPLQKKVTDDYATQPFDDFNKTWIELMLNWNLYVDSAATVAGKQ